VSLRPFCSASTLVLLVGCGGSAALRAADSGDVEGLRKSLKAEIAAGEVDLGEAQDIAERLLRHQIETAQGPAGERSLESLDACAVRFDGSLSRRADHDDELGARAALLRIEAGLDAPMAHNEHLQSSAAGWRAVAARSLTLPARAGAPDDDPLARAGIWRRKLMVDPSAEVREAALRAAVDAADPADAEALLEAGRLEPEPHARRIAIQALGAVGTRRAVFGLKDLWTAADEEGRLAIVGAWAMAARKGRELGALRNCAPTDPQPACSAWHALARVSDDNAGMPSLVAALELTHDAPANESGTLSGNAAAVIERMIDDASTRVRVEAIASAPLAWAYLVEAIVAAASSTDPRVAVAANARRLELGGDDRKAALAALRAVAKDGGLGAEAARAALVAAADREVVPLLASDASSKSAVQRATAARQYATLGQVGEAAALLGDADAAVRTRAACAILEMED
jgi:hypothetical protein